MTSEDKTGLEIEEHGTTLIVRIDGGEHALLDPGMAAQLGRLVDRADKDPSIHAVVFTGAHPDRFLSHADITWLQEGGVGFPPINTRTAGLVFRIATAVNKMPGIRSLAGKTKLKTLLQLDGLHATFLKMNASGTIFIAALNGSALAIGAEFAWACDVRIMADGDFVIGLTEVLLALTPGAGGSQRLTRLIGSRQSLAAILEGKPFTPAEALALGAVDEVVPQNRVLERAIERAEYLSLRSKKGARGDQAVRVLRRLDAAVGRPAVRARGVPRERSGQRSPEADARVRRRNGSDGRSALAGPQDVRPRTARGSHRRWFKRIERTTHNNKAVEGYSGSLDNEVREHGVRILLVEPGGTLTLARAVLRA